MSPLIPDTPPVERSSFFSSLPLRYILTLTVFLIAAIAVGVSIAFVYGTYTKTNAKLDAMSEEITAIKTELQRQREAKVSVRTDDGLDKLNHKIDALQSDIDDVQSTADDVQTSVSEIETKVSSIEFDVSAIQLKIGY